MKKMISIMCLSLLFLTSCVEKVSKDSIELANDFCMKKGMVYYDVGQCFSKVDTIDSIYEISCRNNDMIHTFNVVIDEGEFIQYGYEGQPGMWGDLCV